MTSQTFLWHDYETYGRDPARDRIVQYAAIRTDDNLHEIDDRTMIYCRQSADYLPDPGACMVHGVLPQTANRNGLPEWQFADTVHRQMARAGSCVLGYNTIRFDDEFTRQLLFRNLFDPYAREWQNGNSRWDMIDVVRLARALRPQGIEWPTLADGQPSNRLEHLTDANGISHGDAHDALADVTATIAVARLIKKAQPRLYDYAFRNRTKRAVQQMLTDFHRPALLHVSGMYRNDLGNLSIVMPLCAHPTNANGVLVYDLRHDPTALLQLDSEAIAERLFTPQAELPADIERIAIKTVHANRAPVLAPLSTLSEPAASRWQLDVNQALRYREHLLAASELPAKLATVFGDRQFAARNDPELTLYGGAFANDHDKAQMRHVQKQLTSAANTPPSAHFQDPRWRTLLERLISRNCPELLDDSGRQRWHDLRKQRLIDGVDGFRNVRQFNQLIDELSPSADARGIAMLEQLRHYGTELSQDLCG